MSKGRWIFIGLAWMAAGSLAMAAMQITAPGFANGQPMPAKYARTGHNISPILKVKGVPDKAKSLALIVQDPDAPTPSFTHWILWNISPQQVVFLEGRPPRGAVVGKNSFGALKYDGPQPPSGTHHYIFHLYALDTKIDLPAGSGHDALISAMQGHILAEAQTVGTYQAK